MRNYTVVLISALILLSYATTASARKQHGFYDKAKVVHVEPVFKQVRIKAPERNCERRQQTHRDQSYTGLIAGGIIGGVIGNQFGHGSGRDALTVAGSLLGASIANELGRNHYRRRNEPYCEVTYHHQYEEELVGYDVAYRYHGRTFHRRMSYHPGRKLKVWVGVEPVE